MVHVYRFDGRIDLDEWDILYKKLCELMPEERGELISLIEKEDTDFFEQFKKACVQGYYSDIDINPPISHSADELETIILMIFYSLFKKFPS